MIDHLQTQLALRGRLLTLSVATTGSTDLASTTSAFTRSAGSFIDDGFKVGMEVDAGGFATGANDGTTVITGLTATVMTVAKTLTADSEASGRTITAALPSGRAWENLEFTPVAGEPWVEEQYIPGPTRQITVGKDGQLEITPQYQVQVHAPANTSVGAAAAYADALIGLFAPLTAMTLTNGDTLRVRTDTGPFRGQLQRSHPGWIVVPVTFPCRLRTQNQIT